MDREDERAEHRVAEQAHRRTLLDEFAKVALIGILFGPAYCSPAKELAEDAYDIAEAMLAEREKRIANRG